jgi:hypothetical protein|tara:strand:- start:6338 stop:6571 length:234 start_codon:yes stop_codon:yes gene_type:complete
MNKALGTLRPDDKPAVRLGLRCSSYSKSGGRWLPVFVAGAFSACDTAMFQVVKNEALFFCNYPLFNSQLDQALPSGI